MKTTLKEHLVSAVQTFLATFLAVLGSLITTLDFSTLTADTWKAVIAGLLMTAVRAGVKAVWAWLLPQKV
jgi:hypothetical protein